MTIANNFDVMGIMMGYLDIHDFDIVNKEFKCSNLNIYFKNRLCVFDVDSFLNTEVNVYSYNPLNKNTIFNIVISSIINNIGVYSSYSFVCACAMGNIPLINYLFPKVEKYYIECFFTSIDKDKPESFDRLLELITEPEFDKICDGIIGRCYSRRNNKYLLKLMSSQKFERSIHNHIMTSIEIDDSAFIDYYYSMNGIIMKNEYIVNAQLFNSTLVLKYITKIYYHENADDNQKGFIDYICNKK